MLELNRSLMRRLTQLVVVVSVFVAGLMPQQSEATIMKEFSLVDLCTEADLIAWVEVGSTSSLRAGRHNFIYTDYKIQPLDIWFAGPKARKVAKMKELTLRQIGGRLGDSEQSVVGTAPIKKGERWLVFVRVVEGRTYLVGMGYGGWWTTQQDDVWTAHPGSLHRSRVHSANAIRLDALKEKVGRTLAEVRR